MELLEVLDYYHFTVTVPAGATLVTVPTTADTLQIQ
jgi:hypothetical protein